MIELYERFGDALYFAAIEELLDRNRKAVASIINKMPEDPAYFEDWIDDDGQGIGPWKIACTMTRKGEKLHFDFTGTDPQSPSSINFYLSIAMLVPSLLHPRVFIDSMKQVQDVRWHIFACCIVGVAR